MYLGIDIGTSSIKVVLIDRDQSILVELSEALTIENKKSLYSEQNPEDWYIALVKIFSILKRDYIDNLAMLKSIGITGQMHGAVCLDSKGNVIRPAILWNDGRSFQECVDLMAKNHEFELIGGNKVMPGFTAPKLLWMERNERDNFKKIDKVLLPKDYIRYRITGEFATDMSDASGTLWLNIKDRCWSNSLLASCGLQEKNMPYLYEGTDCSGYLLKDIKKLLGISHDVKVIAGASDNAAGALSMGVYEAGRGMISLGTSGVYFTPTKSYVANPNQGVHTFCHAIPNTWHYMGVILSAASALSWWKNIANINTEKDLIDVAKKYNSDYMPIFLPYLSGERTPHNDPFAKSSFIGMTHATGSSELAQAVLEGISYAIVDCEHAISATGVSITDVSVIGGGSKSLYWGGIISSLLNRNLMYHNESSVGPAFGAARLALYEDCSYTLEQVFQRPIVSNIITPERSLSLELNNRLNIYRDTYQQLSKVFKKIGV